MSAASLPHRPGVVAPPPAIYAAALVVGLVLDRVWHVHVLPPGVARVLGPLLLALSLVGLPAILAFRRHRTSPNPYRPSTTLVTDGPYRLSRNPMYVGFTLMYLGVALWADALWPLVLLPVVLLVMQRGVIVREERYLETVFGDEYRAYRARVRRWV
jgi:protein-S-isoprenylcysteine O-methyltransferase Ste14